MMELKQLAESITMIAFKQKLSKGKPLYFKNRPKLWAEKLERNQIEDKPKKKTLRIVEPKTS